jgi:thiol:disulfide interchange protein DsbC
MNTTSGLATLAALTLLCSSAPGADATPDTPAQITATLQERFPGIQIEHVTPVSQLSGMYEVVTANEIAYTDAHADFLFAGKLVDTRTHQDLTTQRWNELHKIDFDSLPFDLAIKTVRGDGSKRLAVFSDPDCPYCQQLETELQDLTGVTIYTFLYPLESVHPGAREKAVKIWCAKDQAAAWADWMVKRVPPQSDACKDEPMAKLQQLGAKLGINSTPTLYFADGMRSDGVMPRAQLEQTLAASTAVK